MPPPASTDELVQRLRRSGLVPGADLDAFLAGVSPAAPPKDVLDLMVADRLITPFQANRLAVGKYKGFLLGGYIILDKIGTGGMGQVFLAEHANMRRLVAIKVMPAGTVAEDAIARERFLREARAAATLNHPNIVRVFDLNREGGLPYLVMEYIDGLSLQHLVDQAGPVAPAAAADYGRQVALGLQHAHEKGLVHRDIKPGNVLVDRDGVARILDLGLVRNLSDIDTKLTNQLGGQSILGTADYLAPEQAVDSSAVDIRADIYSLGATLYFLLAGHPIFPEGRTAQKLMWQQWKEPAPIRDLRPEVPAGLAAVIHRAIAKKPADRFATPLEMSDALAEFSAGGAAPDPALIPATPARRWSGRSSDLTGTPRSSTFHRTAVPPSAYRAAVPAASVPRSSAVGTDSGPQPVARLPDQVWGHRPAAAETPRPMLPTPPTPPAQPARFDTPLPPDETPLEYAESSVFQMSAAPPQQSAKPPSRLPLAVGLLVGSLAAAGVAVWLMSR